MNIGPFECVIGALIVLALLAVVVLAALLLIRAGRPANRIMPAPDRETPLDVLRRRLAAGEITPEQFDELRRRLEG
jgi:putative membrane protein